MAEDKKNFLQGKMNQDIDDRILPKGEYRSAQNIQVTTSQGSDVGSIQNIPGNTIVLNNDSEFKKYSGLETVGCFFDETNNRVFYFITNYDCIDGDKTGLVGASNGPTTAEQHPNSSNLFCGIFMADSADTTGLPNITKLVEGLFLNFSKRHLITGVNLMEDLLFFTDGLNQPRKINVQKAITEGINHYDNEDKISVAKFAPFMPPLLLDYNTTTLNGAAQATTTDSDGNVINVDPTPSMELFTQNSFPEEFIREKFVRFSYRYRFEDGEYSTIAPFTQICFIPKTKSYNVTQLQKIFKKGEVYLQDSTGTAIGMVNSVTAVNLNIILPSKKIKTDFKINAIEILYKESDNNLIRAVELKELKDSDGSEGVYQYKYKSTLPYKTLPKDQLTRVYDNVPLSAKAQEIISNRVVYGNYVEQRELPNKNNGAPGLNFSVGSSAKYDITNPFGNSDFNNYYLHKEYPLHSIKQRRTYDVGVVLSDKFGRQSPVLTSILGSGSVEVKAKDNNFHSSSWDDTGVISSTSPGNEDYRGDALNITFNSPILDSYAEPTPVSITVENTVTPSQISLFLASLNQDVFELSITQFNSTDSFQVGDYLKGQDKDFVKILSIDSVSNNLSIYTDGPASLLYKNYTGDLSSPVPVNQTTYGFFKYKIVPHGWYSYRVVVKQTEQEYYNVYSPGTISFDNDRDEDKTYIPIAADNINKITRDVEFTATKEEGLSTSKNRVYPKVVPDSASSASSRQSDSELLDVISVGTAKQQGLKNENEHVFDFVYESDKNTLMAQLPFGQNLNNVGTSVNSGMLGTNVAIRVSANKIVRKDQGKSLSWTDDDASRKALYLASLKIGNYLKGANRDLVKIVTVTDFSSVNNHVITCDGAIDVEKDYADGATPDEFDVRVYEYKYGIQDKIAVFETKPFDSVLDIYYETSTAGLVHELNEALSFETTATELNLIETDDFSEGTLFYNENGVDQNKSAATIKLFDQFENEITFGPADNQIPEDGIQIIEQTGNFHPVAYTSGLISQPVDTFKIELNSENNFILKPEASHGNFIYYPKQYPISYDFKFSITNNAGEEVILSASGLELENLAPVFTGGSNIQGVFGSGDVLENFEDTTNGSIDGSDQGLVFVSNGNNHVLEEPDVRVGFVDGIGTVFPSDTGDTFDDDNFIVLPPNEVVRNTEQVPVPELKLTRNGVLTLTDMYSDQLQTSIEVRIIDSDDPGEQPEGFLEDDDAVFGGKSTIHRLDLNVVTGLIVLDPPPEGDINHVDGPGNPASHHIFIDDDDAVTVFNVFFSDATNAVGGFNGDVLAPYWTTEATEDDDVFKDRWNNSGYNTNNRQAFFIQDTLDTEADETALLGEKFTYGPIRTVDQRIIDRVGIFLCSSVYTWTKSVPDEVDGISENFRKHYDVTQKTRIIIHTLVKDDFGKYSLRIYKHDIIKELRVLSPIGTTDAIVDGINFNFNDKINQQIQSFSNHWLQSSAGHLISTGGVKTPIAGVIWPYPPEDTYTNYSHLDSQGGNNNFDIDGGNDDIPGVGSNYFGDGAATTTENQPLNVDPNEDQWDPEFAGGHPEFGNNFPTEGSHKVYGSDTTPTTGVAKPKDRPGDPQQHNLNRAWNDTLVANKDYHVLFDTWGNSGYITVPKAFLCKKKEE